MSRILKKSLAVVLVLALCVSSMIGAISVSAADATYTATYDISFGEVDPATSTVTAHFAMTSTATDLAAVLLTLALPNLPVTAVSTDNVFDLDYSTGDGANVTLPTAGLDHIRVMLSSKTLNTAYNYANVYVTFDVSSKALVAGGYDPDAGTSLSVSVDSVSAASWVGGEDGYESSVWIEAPEDAEKDSVGRVSATITGVTGECAHENTTRVVVTPSSCTVAGKETVTCNDCGNVEELAIAKLDHSFDSGTVTTPEGCLTEGVMTYKCTVCNTTTTAAIPSKGGHVFLTIDKYETNPEDFKAEGDCLSALLLTPLCTACDTEGTTVDTGEQGPHDISAYDVDVAPTCGSAGYKSGTCDLCGDEDTIYYGAPTGTHTWDAGTVTTPATCATAGVKTFTCTVCKTTKTETIAATGAHLWDAGVETTPPTTTSTGVMTYTCVNCPATYTEDIPMLEEDCKHTAYTSAYVTEGGIYKIQITCTECNEVVDTVATDIPSTTSVNSTPTASRTLFVADTFGFNYVLTKSQLTSYASYGLRIFRKATNASYAISDANAGEIKSFDAYGSKRVYKGYSGLALYEFSLPVTAVIVGYDASGNIMSISNPMVDYPIDYVWNMYNTVKTNGDTVKTTCFSDMVNLSSESQLFFGKEGTDLANVILPRDKFAFVQSDATQTDPVYDLSTMPNSIVNNPDATVSTSTYYLQQNLALGSSPYINYYVIKGKNLDLSKLKLEVSYTSNAVDSTTGENIVVSKTVTGTAATDTTDPWSTYSTRAYYSFVACRLYDTNRTITAKFTYNGIEMYTAVYSVETYIAQNMTHAAMGPALVALGKFGNSVRAFFGY